MSDDAQAAAKRAELEEKRRAARRARVLGSSGSRLDAICGIAGTRKNGDYTDTTPQADAESGHEHVEPLIPSPPESSQPLPIKPIESTSQSTDERNDVTEITLKPSRAARARAIAAETRPRPSGATSGSRSASSTSYAKTDIQIPANKKDLKQRQARVLGFVLAFIYAVLCAKLPQYSTHWTTAFLAMDVLMWLGVFHTYSASQSGGVVLQFVISSFAPNDSEKSKIIVDSIDYAFRVVKGCYYVVQDALIAQFFVAFISGLSSSF